MIVSRCVSAASDAAIPSVQLAVSMHLIVSKVKCTVLTPQEKRLAAGSSNAFKRCWSSQG